MSIQGAQMEDINPAHTMTGEPFGAHLSQTIDIGRPPVQELRFVSSSSEEPDRESPAAISTEAPLTAAGSANRSRELQERVARILKLNLLGRSWSPSATRRHRRSK